MIGVKNTEKMRNVRNVVASLAVENMYLSSEFASKLIDVANGRKTTDDLRKEIIEKYAEK